MYIRVLKQLAENLVSDIFSREEKERILMAILRCDALVEHDEGCDIDNLCTVKQYPVLLDGITPTIEHILSRSTVVNDVYIKASEYCAHTIYEIKWGEQKVFEADRSSTELVVSVYKTSPMGWEKHLRQLAETEPAILKYVNNFSVADAKNC